MISAVFSDFLDHFEELRSFSKECEFSAIENPVDKAVYPFICRDLPIQVEHDVHSALENRIGRKPEINTLFMRMSPAGVHVPHIAHTDNSMGKYSLMLYLNDQGGTSFLRHKETGICAAPESQKFVELVSKDQNEIEKWDRVYTVLASPNRALIFESNFFHCADPVGGFGTDQSDARIVLTAFFS